MKKEEFLVLGLIAAIVVFVFYKDKQNKEVQA